MKRIACLPVICLLLVVLGVCIVTITSRPAYADQNEAIIIDHTCTDLSKIPAYWLEQAKALTLHYAHTSHGSQINTGILNLESQNSAYSVAIRTGTAAGLPPQENPPALRIYDGNPPETYINASDYWYGDEARNRTRAVADTGDYDFSMWSWCGEVSNASENTIQYYLDTMNQFESEYPGMRFIYMTGHLNGTGSSGNLHVRNEQIRAYCRTNNKVLFDFADMERYDPDGTDYLDLGATDNCAYSGGNWAQEWCAAHPGSDLCAECTCAHSQALNCNVKGRAFWWMMARLAGWDPGGSPTANFSGTPTTGTAPLEVSFTDASTGDISSRSWDFDSDGATDSTGQNPSFTYTDPGTYTVELRIAGPGGTDTETKTHYITVTAPLQTPIADFSGAPTTGTAPLEVSFTDLSTGDISSRSWDFDSDGAIDSTGQNPSFTYADPGTYTVELRIAGPGGTDTETKIDYITVTAAPLTPVADFSGTPTTGTAPLEVTFTDLSTGEIDNWSWDFDNDGTIDSTGQNPSFTYADPGTYTIALVVSGSGGNHTNTKAEYITVTGKSGGGGDSGGGGCFISTAVCKGWEG